MHELMNDHLRLFNKIKGKSCQCFFMILFVNILFSQINVSISEDIREVPIFGIANSSMRYNNFQGSSVIYDFGQSDFEEANRCINPQVMTFPSANPCYFDWENGWALDQESIIAYVNTLDLPYADYHDFITNGDYFFSMANEDYEWWENNDGTWNPIDMDVQNFSNFIVSENMTGTFSLNMLTSSIETTMNMVRDRYADGVPFKYIELGSEYYLRSGGDKWDDENGNYMYDEGETLTKDRDGDGKFDPGRFEFIYPTPKSFAEECNDYIDSLSNILSADTKYAISSKNKSGDPRSSDWNRQVLKHIDSDLISTIYLSWHEYLRFEKKEDDLGNQDTLTADQVMAFPQFMHEDMITASGMDPASISALEDELDLNIKIWLTESAFRELGEKPWIYKWAQSLVNMQNHSLMLKNPYVEIIMLQALHGYSSTSAINHGYEFPDDFPLYVDQDSCSPHGRTATAFSIYFWNTVSEGMSHMQEIKFDDENADHLGMITEDPFDGDSELDSNQSPEVGFEYSYLMGWKFNDVSTGNEKGIIINVANTSKTIHFNDGSSIFNEEDMKCIQITSLNSLGEPSIDQYITGDGDLNHDTTDVNSTMVIPPYSVNLFIPNMLLSSKNESSIPKEIRLQSNYPNPFNPSTTISYEISRAGDVHLGIYNLNGQLIETLVNGHMVPGHHSMMWNGNELSSGLYFYKLNFEGEVLTKKMLYIK